jgi:hypothetical protein
VEVGYTERSQFSWDMMFHDSVVVESERGKIPISAVEDERHVTSKHWEPVPGDMG